MLYGTRLWRRAEVSQLWEIHVSKVEARGKEGRKPYTPQEGRNGTLTLRCLR